MLRATLIALIRLYRVAVSPWIPARCRFTPTCSEYGLEAVERHGALRGSWLIVRRLARCQPWGGSGFDPVPELEKGGVERSSYERGRRIR